MTGREVDEAYRKEEKEYWDNLWDTHYADKHDGPRPEYPAWAINEKRWNIEGKLNRQASEGMDILRFGMRDLFYGIIYAPSSAYYGVVYDGPRQARRGMNMASGMLNYEVAALKAERAGNKVEFAIMTSNYTDFKTSQKVCREEFGGELAEINTANEADMFVALLTKENLMWGRPVFIRSVDPSVAEQIVFGARTNLNKYRDSEGTKCANNYREYHSMERRGEYARWCYETDNRYPVCMRRGNN